MTLSDKTILIEMPCELVLLIEEALNAGVALGIGSGSDDVAKKMRFARDAFEQVVLQAAAKTIVAVKPPVESTSDQTPVVSKEVDKSSEATSGQSDVGTNNPAPTVDKPKKTDRPVKQPEWKPSSK